MSFRFSPGEATAVGPSPSVTPGWGVCAEGDCYLELDSDAARPLAPTKPTNFVIELHHAFDAIFPSPDC